MMQLPEGFVLDTPKPKTAPSLIRGNPKPVDPYKEAAELRAQEDQERQRAAFEASQKKAEIDIQKGQRDLLPGADTTESEKTAGFLATRVAGGIKELDRILAKDPTAKSPTFGVEAVRTIFGDTAANYFTDADRQQVVAAQRDILDAALTLGTGAAYTAEQLEGYRQSYFPQLFDDEATVEAKQKRLRQLLESAKVKAGRSAPMIEQALSAVSAAGGFIPDAPVVGKRKGEPLIDPELGVSVIPDDGSTTTGFTPDKYVSDELKAKNDALNAKWLSGEIQTLDQLYAEADRLGLDISGTDRNNLELQLRRGERGQFVPRPDQERTGIQKAAGQFLDSPIGAYGVGSLNALTLGGLDELVGFAAGEDAGARTQDIKEYLRENRPIASLAGEVGGSILGLKGAGSIAPGLTNALATKTGATALGATYGALDQNDNRLIGAATGGIIGRYAPQAVDKAVNALAPVAGKVSNAITSRFPGASARNALLGEIDDSRAVIQAGMEENIPVRLPDAASSARNASAKIEASARVGPDYRRALEGDIAAIENKVIAKAGDGAPLEQTNLGDRIQGAVNRNREAKSIEFDARYKRVDRLAPGHKAPASNTIGLIDNEIARLKAEAPKGSAAEVKILETLKSDLSETGLTAETVRGLRRRIRNLADQSNITAGQFDNILLDLQKSAGAELENSLAGNPAALGALRSANKDYAEYVNFKKEINRLFVGDGKTAVTPEQAASRLLAMTKRGGNSNGFARFAKILEPEELADLRATVAYGLGRNAKGDFSPAILANLAPDAAAGKGTHNWATLTEIFGKEGVQSLKNLARLSNAKAGTMAGLNNSKSGVVMQPEANSFRRLMATAWGFSVGDVAGALAAAGGDNLVSRLGEKRAMRMLLNPDFTRMLASAPNTRKPQVINQWFKALEKTAPQNSVAAADIAALKQALIDSFGASPGKLAASEEENNRRPEIPQ